MKTKYISNLERVKEQAQEQGLDYVEITYGSNGYPHGLGEIAIIGFENFQQAKEFATAENCTVVCIQRRDGWQFWENIGPVDRPLSVSDYVEDLGDNYYIERFDIDFFCERMQDLLTSFTGDFSDIEEYIKNQKELQELTENLHTDKSIIIGHGKVFDVVDNEMMGYHEDVWSYKIAVLVEKE